jgi:ribonuclease E
MENQTQPDAEQMEAEQAEAQQPGAGKPEQPTAGQEAGASGGAAETDAVAPAETPAVDPFALSEAPGSLLFHAPDLSAVQTSVSAQTDRRAEDEESDEEAEEGGGRRRRSRRSRGKSRGGSAGQESQESPDAQPEESETGEGSTRRRRRRRRGEEDLELTGGGEDDPPNTVTRVRAPRQSAEPASDKVRTVKGSTRLEAKKQRRRESRDSGRRRHVITEAEFLARRESVDRQMVVRQRDDRIQIAVLEDGMLAEHFVSRTQQDSLIGNVYLGKVQNVLPSMEAAFVDIGRGRNAVLYAGEVDWEAAGLGGQPRRIELALKSGDTVLVQVTKDPVGHKGARLTSQISLPGRYLVYVPGGSMTGISRKLPDVERNRLKRILKERMPESAGVIVRTAAEGASEEELTHDINRLRAQWEGIQASATSGKTPAPELLHGEPDLTIKVVRDVFNEDFSKLIVSGEEAWDTIEAYVTYVAPDLVGRLEKWTGTEDIFAASRIDEQIQKALDRKVFLPSGGSLVIDRTEAMTVVDVNTGKFTGSGGNLEETVTKNNLEAAEEVVRQLRLRDIGGIIVIDFIDMVLEANRDLVLRRLVECLGRDRTKHQVAEVTSLGLVQMTRKRMGTGLLEVFGENCEHCGGRGIVTHDEPVEHRRHAVSPDNHQQHLRQEKMSRSERRRNRSRNQQQAEQTTVQEPKAEDPERQARAEAARAALASIAAATHASHESGGTGATEQTQARDRHGKPEREEQDGAAGQQADGQVLKINGETVTLPRGEGARAEAAREATRLSLESLTEAFNRGPVTGESPAAVEGGSAAGPAGTVQAAAGEQPEPKQPEPKQPGPKQPEPKQSGPKQRRAPRRAASSQGTAATAAIERAETPQPAEPAGTGGTFAAPAAKRVRRRAGSGQAAAGEAASGDKERPGNGPQVLGVGVPAAEL